MALDFHIAKSESEAPGNYGGVSFDENIHEIMFYRNGLPQGDFQYFKRMKDYYKDAKYIGDDINKLLAEIKILKISFTTNSGIINQLNEIERMCHEANVKKMNLWVYCD